MNRKNDAAKKGVGHLFDGALKIFERAFIALEGSIPKPQKVPVKDGFWYRYVEKTPEQAIIQKLARYVSSLHAAWILLRHGFVQEQAALQRMLDEFNDDITFIAIGLMSGDWTRQHDAYLEYFWEEEFVDPSTPIDQNRRRPSVPRKKIYAYLARHGVDAESDPSTSAARLKTISGAYSGFIHGASPQIMDLYGGNPPRYHLRGMVGTPRMASGEQDLWNYFFRGFLAFLYSAIALKNEKLQEELEQALRVFDRGQELLTLHRHRLEIALSSSSVMVRQWSTGQGGVLWSQTPCSPVIPRRGHSGRIARQAAARCRRPRPVAGTSCPAGSRAA